MEKNDKIKSILHLSDIHLGSPEDANKYRIQLETDLKMELNLTQLDYLVISGDIANHSTPDEYKAAFALVDNLGRRFNLNPERISSRRATMIIVRTLYQ